MKRKPKKKVKHGHSRTVILFSGYAFKFPSTKSWEGFVRGLLGNMTERRWRRFSESLCPIAFSVPGGFLNVMPRASSLSTDEHFKAAHLLSKKCIGLPVEMKPDSFGVLDSGKVVFVDYGDQGK